VLPTRINIDTGRPKYRFTTTYEAPVRSLRLDACRRLVVGEGAEALVFCAKWSSKIAWSRRAASEFDDVIVGDAIVEASGQVVGSDVPSVG